VPTVTVTVAAVSDAAENGGDGTFRFTRDGDTTDPLTVSFTFGGTATHGSDYAPPGGWVMIAAGEESADLAVVPLADNLIESDETVVATVADGCTAYVGGSTDTLTIGDDPAAVQVEKFSDGAETGVDGIFRFTRTGGDPTQPMTVSFYLTGTATAPTDYTADGSVAFAAGETSADVHVVPVQDAVVEGDESVTLTVTGWAYTYPPDLSATLTIADDPTVVSVTAVADAAEPATAGAFRLTRAGGDLSHSLTIGFSFGATAFPSGDFSAPLSATFGANCTIADVVVSPAWDAVVEGDETVILTIAGGGSEYAGGGTATILILDDPPTVTVEVLANAHESGAAGLFRLTRSGGDLSQPLDVQYTLGGTAMSGTDYEALYGSIQFGANATTADVTVTPIPDNLVESGNETVTLTAANGGSAYVGGDSATMVLVDDAPYVSFDWLADAVAGGDQGAFRLIRSGGDLAHPLNVTYTIGGTAAPGTDYAALAGLATFDADADTLDVVVTPTAGYPGRTDGTVSITLTGDATTYLSVQGGSDLSAETATLTITAAVPWPMVVDTFEDTWYPAMVEGLLERVHLYETVTWVSADRYRWELTFTNTSLTGAFATEGIRRLDLGMPDLPTLLSFETPEGWTATKDSGGGNLEGMGFVRWETTSDFLMPVESRTFAFYTEPRSRTQMQGIAHDRWYSSSAEGAGIAPEPPKIESVTWVPRKPVREISPLTANPNPGGGQRIFPEKAAPGEKWVRDRVDVEVKLTQALPGVTVKLNLYDVDDPSSAAPPVDDDTGNSPDNRVISLEVGTVKTQQTDARGIARFGPIWLGDIMPGDNFRVVATVDPAVNLATGVAAKQNDGVSAGVYFAGTGAAVPGTNASTVKSGLLTVWRKLHIERDHMGAPSAGEYFAPEDLAGNGDVNPNGPIADMPLADAVTGFRPAYIEVVDDLATYNTDAVFPFTHNLYANLGWVQDYANAIRNVANESEFWTIQVIGAYEGPTIRDNDPNGAGGGVIGPWLGVSLVEVPTSFGRPVFVFTEVIRDVKADVDHFPGLVAEGDLLKRVTYHEIVHPFGLEHGTSPGDEGPLSLNNNYSAAALALTEKQLAHIRGYGKPG
jgi:hypothetical protein